MRIGILFGGPSREREIAFAGGRTVYDNLNKSLFEAVPIFIDSFCNFVLLDWQYIYKGTIRDFYPPVSFLPNSEHGFQVYAESLENADMEAMIACVGKKIPLQELSEHIDFAFLALHGEFGEDGKIQGLLESLQIPYSGSGIRANAIGIDKAFQKKMMQIGGFAATKVHVLQRNAWKKETNASNFYREMGNRIGFPIVIRPANQGSSIGVSIIKEAEGESAFCEAIDKAFFITNISHQQWTSCSVSDKIALLRQLSDIREGLGFPLLANGKRFLHPDALFDFLEAHFTLNKESVSLESDFSEQVVLLEEFITGKEFSCIVLQQEDGTPIALPPTEIIKGEQVFDYRAKYLPGLARKITPIDLPDEHIENIRKECERLFQFFEFSVYARIDGFIRKDGAVILNDPNTTSGMLPSSFFFHQAAEIGLNPSQFLTYIIRISLQQRIVQANHKPHYAVLLQTLDERIGKYRSTTKQRKKVAVLLGGYSSERHISVESGRNVFEKLASSDKYEAIPIFLTGNDEQHRLFQIPINLLLKDNADDIKDKIVHFKKHPVVEHIKQLCHNITQRYASQNVIFSPKELTYENLAEQVDVVFIALHGRPGEDGAVQQYLEKFNIPFNGSSVQSANLTIDKFNTLQTLKAHGFKVTEQFLLGKKAFTSNPTACLEALEAQFEYPFIAKPVDDGCSSAVKKIKNREQIIAYLETLFRAEDDISNEQRTALQLKANEEFPRKNVALIETLIEAKGAEHFLEVTGGLLTHLQNGKVEYEMFEPSEALASGEVLSLEEKFLAGEGQNITPARFSKNPKEYAYIAEQVKSDLQRAAQVLQVKGYARIDAFVRVFADGKVETIIIEVNSLPGMTPATCIFHQAAINQYKPYHFIDKILEFAIDEQRKN